MKAMLTNPKVWGNGEKVKWISNNIKFLILQRDSTPEELSKLNEENGNRLPCLRESRFLKNWGVEDVSSTTVRKLVKEELKTGEQLLKLMNPTALNTYRDFASKKSNEELSRIYRRMY